MTEISFLYALLPLFAWGIGDAIAHGPANRIASTIIVTIQTFVTTSLILLVALFSWDQFTWGTETLLPLIAGLFGALGFAALLLSLREGKVGVTSSITSAFPIPAILFGVFVLGESLSLPIVFAMILIFSGIITLSFNFKDWRDSHILDRNNNLKFAFVSLFFWGVHHILLKLSTNELAAIQVSLLMEGAAFVTMLTIFMIKRHTLADLATISVRDRMTIVVIGALFAIGAIGINAAYAIGSLSITAATVGAIPFVAALAAFIVHREKMSKKEWIAALMVVTGLITLGYNSV